MRLKVNEKIISLGGKYFVLDTRDNEVFIVDGNFGLPRKFEIIPAGTDQVAMTLKKKMLRPSMFAKFDFIANDKVVLTAKRKFSIKSKWEMIGELGEYRIDGNIFDYDFTISKNGQDIASIYKKFTLYRDGYILDIDDQFDSEHLQVILMSVMLDHTHHRKNNNNH